MTSPHTGLRPYISMEPDQLLHRGEVIAIVDDELSIREPLKFYFEQQGYTVVDAGTGSELFKLLQENNIALILLDIGLPDRDGTSLLPEITAAHPEISIVMLSGQADIQVALECMRNGADDYITKPVQFNEILVAVEKNLEKRRLIYENRRYQEDLEQASFRIQLLHQLSNKMNSVYLNASELDEILRAILVGITANEGLRFNRAFLALLDNNGEFLEGRMAIGPNCRDEAGQIWTEMKDRNLNFLEIVHNLSDSCILDDSSVNQIIKTLKVPVSESEHILIKSAFERISFKVSGGTSTTAVHPDLIKLLDEDTFVVVPLFAPGRSIGVIIADNYVTRKPIPDSHVSVLELFASQGSLAIEQSSLYRDMEKKIGELEEVTHELDKNKDLLIEAERYAALGQMAAQLVHIIRNPITSIGGVARILARKIQGEEWKKYLDVMVKETDRLEATLTELFDFVSQPQAEKTLAALYPLIKKTLILLQTSMQKQNITWELDLKGTDPVIYMDPKQIRRVFLNILRNAIEAMPQGGTLLVSAYTDQEWAHVSISDSGSGLSGSYIDKATEPFFTTKTYGTGMGLTLVDRFIKGHGGSFSLNRLENGLEVQINLPLAPNTM
ncbi:MAG: response regulator [Desulfobulbaceae bacterium]|nr:response regulator [Desulfobulbaceae bacterium]